MSKLLATRRSGFSLVELLISTAIAIIIGSAVILLLVQETQLTATQNRNMMNAEQMRSIMVFMADEIQMMGNGIQEPYIDISQPQELQFYSDIDNDGRVDRIHYFRQGTELRRTLSTSADRITWTEVGTDVLIPNILAANTLPNPGLLFNYYGVNNGTPATSALIRAVEIHVGLNQNQTGFTTALTSGKLAQQNMVTYATIRNRNL